MMELPLQRYHDRSGAVFRTDAAWSIPASYASIDAEVRAVRTRAGVIDFSDRAKIELTGSERVPFLDGVLTADVKILAPGSSVYALLLNDKSRVLGDLRAYALSDSLVLDVDAAQKDSVLHILEKARVSDDVEFRVLSGAGHVEVHGPIAGALLADAVGPGVRGLPRNAFLDEPIGRRAAVRVAHVPSIAEPGFAIWSIDSDLGGLWEGLIAAGAGPTGRDAWDVLRIEAGVPKFGVDMGEDTLALEAAPLEAISYSKGCYVGQEVVARGTYVGQMRRKLLGLRADGDVTPVRGDRVSAEGRDIGFVTSGVWSPTRAAAIAMALLRVDFVSAAQDLFIHRGGWDVRARLHPLPFVPRSA